MKSKDLLSTKNFYHILISYDGTCYFGWQSTNQGPSIQASLQKAIFGLSSEIVEPEAASRTDRGVHARGQSVAFALEKYFDPTRLKMALNAHLPPDIRVLDASIVNSEFHPTLDALAKEYHYRCSLEPFQRPHDRHFAWHIPYELDFELMRCAAKEMLGIHDFTAFTTEIPKNPICYLHFIDLVFESQLLVIKMQGDRFIYKMARTIAGTLIYVGRKKISIEQVRGLFVTPLRSKAGMTAPARGLFLNKVLYVC